jgi:peptidoglycan-associated lipoprotein
VAEDDSLVALAENEMIGMSLAAKMTEPKDIFAEPLDKAINTPLTELSPIETADGELFYATFNKKSKIVITGDEDEDFHLKIYSTKAGSEGNWAKPKKLSKKINREDFHTGNVAFSKDGRTMYFTRSRLSGDSITSSTVYTSNYDGDKWEGARELEGVNGDWVATHPAPGALFGDEVLYFSSNMPGGYGGFDIYYCTYRGGTEFSAPVNLGEVINSTGDEVTPFYSDGLLYYSSDGLPGIGGFDVFGSSWDGTEWSKPVNMGLVYNSTYDDLYFSWNDEKKKGYLISNRPYPKKRSSKNETCCDDIFEISKQDIEINALVTVYDADKKPLPGAKITLAKLERGGEKENVDAKTSQKGNTFNFPLKVDKAYRLIIERDGYKPDSFEVMTVGLIEPKTFKREFFLEGAPTETVTESVTVMINEPIRLNNIYYDFDDDKILPDAEKDLNVIMNLMQQYPDMVIELSSHTDARGNDSYNENLSQRRAESARRWLLNEGIPAQRIEAVGYGESQILNRCSNGVDCNEDEHRFNRRTEFKIIAGPRTIQIEREVNRPASGEATGGVIREQDEDMVEYVEPDPAGNVEAVAKEAQLVLTKKFHDFGIVHPGEKRSVVLEIKNTGDAALVLESVTGCKCMQVNWPTYPIMPGKVDKISAIYDSKGRSGEDEITLSIIANTNQEVHTARVRAFVQ